MAEITYTTKDKQKHTVNYNLGSNLQEAIGLYGEDVVFKLYHAKAVIKIADSCRPQSEDGKSDSEVQAYVDALKLDAPAVRASKSPKDPVAAFLASFAKMTPEGQMEALQKIKQSRQG
jgi:hypothetical protein